MRVVSHSYQGCGNLIRMQNPLRNSTGVLAARASWKLEFAFMLHSY